MQCIFCKSENAQTLQTSDGLHAACPDCRAVWEPDTRKPNQLCDNCAFRPGSPESQDAAKWAELQATTVEGGEPFFCHKDMRGRLDVKNSKIIFTPPDLADDYDGPPLKLCRGWWSRRMAFLSQEKAT